MARISPLWRSQELTVYRFDHPVEHEDQPYEEVAEGYRASFVEGGDFDLHVGDRSWRLTAGDVMLSHPGMRFAAGFQGKGFNDVCLSIVYETAEQDGFDPDRSWRASGRHALKATNRLRYLRWGLQRGVEAGAHMLTEYCATEIFRAEPSERDRQLFRDKTLAWYAERVTYARERMHTEFAEDLSTSDLARSVGMSLFHFSRVFAELTGRPPHTYLLDVRLEQAHAMLREGRSVTETCYACGFNNLSHFSRLFASRRRMRPSEVARTRLAG
ncbi:MAG TPA: helix-turn-helix transcriptional regulator [Phenylobacterium sp.]|nr:helix-turn-helix transcriptional regulator [Phenylobacterium sp.]